MVPTLFVYELGLIALVWLFLMLYWLGPNAAAGDARISAVDVRDVADVAVAALTTAQHDNQIYALPGVEPGVRDALGQPPRTFDAFACDYAPLFA